MTVQAAGWASACVLSMSAIADDPRVRRQGQTLYEAGWKVAGAGMPGAASKVPDWEIYTRDNLPQHVGELSVEAPPASPWMHRSLGGGRTGRAMKALDAFLGARERAELAARDPEAAYRLRRMSIAWRPIEAHRLYWSYSSNIHDIYKAGLATDAYLWIANDWSVLPIAQRLANERGGVYVYDSHELAMDEYGQLARWRIYDKPIVDIMEGSAIRGAAAVSAISRGIAEKLRDVYGLGVDCIELRNTPYYQEHAFRPCGDEVRVLYHGIVVPHRGLEAAVQSIPLWPKNFSLTLRGPVAESFRSQLQDLAVSLDVADRLHFAPPVPMTDLIREAAAFDVGLCTPPSHSQHNVLSLPNKVFEYIMAGLALFLTDLPEHRRLVTEHGVGFLAKGEDPASLGRRMAELSAGAIDTAKRRSLTAARELCWENEQRRFAAMCAKASGIDVMGSHAEQL